MTERWQCPTCGTYSVFDINSANHAKAFEITDASMSEAEEGDTIAIGGELQVRRCSNPSCLGITIYIRGIERCYYSIPFGGDATNDRPTSEWIQVLPRPVSMKIDLPNYIPTPIRQDFIEAALIKSLSPKSTVALCRRCIQYMIRDFWNITKRNLSDEIKELEASGNAPSDIEALTAIREMGNFGAHPERDVSIIVDIEPEDAELSIQIVQTLIHNWYINKHEHEERQTRLTASINEKKAKRRTS